MKETNLGKYARLKASELGARMFRNNVGMGWAPAGSGSNIVHNRGKAPRQVTLFPGDVLVRKARPLHAGLATGSADLIGWRPLLISASMVGRPIAQFTSAELKTQTGKMREGQQDWMDLVNLHGGRAGVIRSLDEFITFMEADES